MTRLRQRSTMRVVSPSIELLVVILIIGILAAIAIPSFLNQKSKATDADAKEAARTAEPRRRRTRPTTAASTRASTRKRCKEYEPAPAARRRRTTTPALSSAEAIEGGEGYAVTATAPTSSDTFTRDEGRNRRSHADLRSDRLEQNRLPAGSW